MHRIFVLLIVSVLAINAVADTFSISEKDKTSIVDEAENWIDDMPAGFQDRLSDAVAHAMTGVTSEINYFRNLSDTTGIKSYKVSVKDFQGGSNSEIPMRLYKAQTKQSSQVPLLVYFHGGGWSVGSINTSDKFCRALASMGKVNVISVEYPLAPEHPYPSALNVCEEAVRYIVSQAKDYGSSPDLVSLGGDGSGGNLALTVYSQLRNKVNIKSMVLYYPMVNSSGQLDAAAKRKYGRGYGFDSRLWEAFVKAYNDTSTTYIEDLPSTLLITAGRDIIINEEKTLSSYKKVKYIEFDGALHGFLTDGRQPTAFRTAVTLTNKFLSIN